MFLLRIFSFVGYIIFVFCLHCFVNSDTSVISYIFLFFIDVPVCAYLVCCIHEAAHYICFLFAGAEVKSVRLGMIRISGCKKGVKVNLTNDSLFTGDCVVKSINYKSKCYMIAALLSGGVSSIIVAAIIFLCIFWKKNMISPFLLCMVFTGLISGSFSLFYPASADRKLLKIFLEKDH